MMFYKMYNLSNLFILLILRLLDREQVGDEDAAVNDEEDDSFLKAFKVYISSSILDHKLIFWNYDLQLKRIIARFTKVIKYEIECCELLLFRGWQIEN